MRRPWDSPRSTPDLLTLSCNWVLGSNGTENSAKAFSFVDSSESSGVKVARKIEDVRQSFQVDKNKFEIQLEGRRLDLTTTNPCPNSSRGSGHWRASDGLGEKDGPFFRNSFRLSLRRSRALATPLYFLPVFLTWPCRTRFWSFS